MIYKSRIAIAFTVWLSYFAGPVSAAVSQCQIDTGRRGLERIDLFVNPKNDGYLLLRFTDPRFDDTTEVYRLRGCSKVASGVTSKSKFDTTLLETGFQNFGQVAPGAQREVINSYYGEVRVSVSASDITAVLSETDPDRLGAIAALKRLVLLQEDVPLARIALIKDDQLLARIPAGEFTNPSSQQLSEQELARGWMSLPTLLSATSGSALHKILVGPYQENLSSEARKAVNSRPAMRPALDQAAATLIKGSRTDAMTVARESLVRMESIGHDSEPTQMLLMGMFRRDGNFDVAVDLYKRSKYYKSPAVRAEIVSIVEDMFAALATKNPAADPDAITSALNQLAASGFQSDKITKHVIAILRATPDLTAGIGIAKQLMRFSTMEKRQAEIADILGDTFVALATPSASSEVVTSALDRLAPSGFESDKVNDHAIAVLRATPDLTAGIGIAKQLMRFSTMEKRQAEIADVLGDTFVALATPSASPETVTSALNQLADSGFQSDKITKHAIAILRVTPDFHAALGIAEQLVRFSGTSTYEELRRETASLILASYVRMSEDKKSRSSDASLASKGLVALHRAGFLTQAAGDVFMRVVRQRGTFADAVAAYETTQDVTYVDKLQGMAKTAAEARALEAVAIKVLASPGRLFDLDFVFGSHDPHVDETKHMGIFALYTMYVDSRFYGKLKLAKSKKSPLVLRHGQYRVNAKLTLSYQTQYSQVSRWLGNKDSTDQVSQSRQIQIIVTTDSAGNISGEGAVDFGVMRVMNLKRGSSGGFELQLMTSHPEVSVSIESIEPLS